MKTLAIQLGLITIVPSCAYRTGGTPEGGRWAEFTLGTDEQDAWTSPQGAGRMAQNQSKSVKFAGQAIVAGIGLGEAGNAVSAISAGRTTRALSRNATSLGIVNAKEATKQAGATLKAGVETTKILNP
jgi:hypothetical protein